MYFYQQKLQLEFYQHYMKCDLVVSWRGHSTFSIWRFLSVSMSQNWAHTEAKGSWVDEL